MLPFSKRTENNISDRIFQTFPVKKIKTHGICCSGKFRRSCPRNPKPRKPKKNNEKVYSLPGLSLNVNTKNPKKIVQNLLSKELSDKTDIVIWHDVLNNSISKHESNNFRPLTVPQLLEILKFFENKLRALVYCQRFRTPNILPNLKEIEKTTNIKVFSIVDDFISTRKQKDPDFLKNLKALHQIPEIELKHIDFLLRKESELNSITDKSRPKRPSKRARKAIQKAVAAAPSS